MSEVIYNSFETSMNTLFLLSETTYKIKREELQSRKRSRPLVDLRRFITAIIFKEHHKTLKEFGFELRKDHATIIHYKSSHDNLLSRDKGYENAYNKFYKEYKLFIYDTGREERISYLEQVIARASEELKALKTIA